MELSRKRPAEIRLVLLLVVAIGWFYAWTVAPEGIFAIRGGVVSGNAAALLGAWAGLAAAAALLDELRERYRPHASAAVLLVGVLALGLAQGIPAALRRGAPDALPIASGFAGVMVGLWALVRGWHGPHRRAWFVAAACGIFAAIVLGSFHRLQAEEFWFEPQRWSHFFPYVLPVAPGSASVGRVKLEHFLPGLTLAAGMVLLALSGWAGIRHWLGWVATVVGGAALVYASSFGVLTSLRDHDFLRLTYPAVYRETVHWGNAPSVLLDRLRHPQYGPVELKLAFPVGLNGVNESLVVTGAAGQTDCLFVHYAGPDGVQFGFDHAGSTVLVGDPVPIRAGVAHMLRIDLGSLYPPVGHPYFDAVKPEQAGLLPRTLAVTLDGQVVLHRLAGFHDAVSAAPSIGSAGGRPGCPPPFSGRILSSRRLPGATVSPLAAAGGVAGPMLLELKFPVFAGVRSEPLLSTGVSTRGDLVFVHYLGPRSVAFGFDHWSRGGPVSGPFMIDPSAVQSVEIDTSAINPKNPGQLRLRLNGQVVFDLPASAYACSADTVSVGTNAIHASTATERFTGLILAAGRLDH